MITDHFLLKFQGQKLVKRCQETEGTVTHEEYIFDLHNAKKTSEMLIIRIFDIKKYN